MVKEGILNPYFGGKFMIAAERTRKRQEARMQKHPVIGNFMNKVLFRRDYRLSKREAILKMMAYQIADARNGSSQLKKSFGIKEEAEPLPVLEPISEPVSEEEPLEEDVGFIRDPDLPGIINLADYRKKNEENGTST